MTQYILAVLTFIVLFVLLRLWVTAYDLKKLQERLEALETAKGKLEDATQLDKLNIDALWKAVEALRNAAAAHREAVSALASRTAQQRSGAQPVQQYSSEAAAAARKRSTPRKPS